jgi:hypothetical protein
VVPARLATGKPLAGPPARRLAPMHHAAAVRARPVLYAELDGPSFSERSWHSMRAREQPQKKPVGTRGGWPADDMGPLRRAHPARRTRCSGRRHLDCGVATPPVGRDGESRPPLLATRSPRRSPATARLWVRASPCRKTDAYGMGDSTRRRSAEALVEGPKTSALGCTQSWTPGCNPA